MQCEMCGKELPFLKTVSVEGTRLKVCPDCAKFGMQQVARGGGQAPTPDVIVDRLKKRESRMKSRDVYSQDTGELASDYPQRIRQARSRTGLSQDELGQKINEKKSIISKLETGDITPDKKLSVKLEKALEISLASEGGAAVAASTGKRESNALTIGDLLQEAMDKK